MKQGADKSPSSTQEPDDIATPDAFTALNQGANNSISSTQEPDDVAAPSRAMGNTILVAGPFIYVASLSHEPTDVTPAKYKPTDATEAERQMKDLELIADSRSNNGLRDDKQLDFSLLPTLVLINIFSFLPQRDQLVLSVTCKKLYEVCKNSPVLWRSVFINIIHDTRPNSVHYATKLSAADKSVLRAQCHAIKNLVIPMKYNYMIGMLDHNSYSLLCKTIETSQLKHLEISADSPRSNVGDKQWREFLQKCMTSQSQLCSLNITTNDWIWNMEHTKSGIANMLKKSSFTSTLTHLYLDIFVQEIPNDVYTAIERFQNLQSLAIPYEWMSDSLLKHFPEQLNTVHFIIIIKWLTKIHVTIWPQVLASKPQLTVGMIFNGCPIPHDLRDPYMILPPEVPVSSLRIEKQYFECQFFNWVRLTMVSVRFRQLEKLEYRCFQRELGHQFVGEWLLGYQEDMLVDTVSKCPKLVHLDYIDLVSRETVLTLAPMRKWRKLDFAADCIIFKDSSDREKEVHALCEEMSKILGRPWWPRSLIDTQP